MPKVGGQQKNQSVKGENDHMLRQCRFSLFELGGFYVTESKVAADEIAEYFREINEK